MLFRSQTDQTWNNATPDCDEVNCGSPSAPSNGDVDTSSGTDFNGVATFSCDTGYTMSGASNTTCQTDLTWSNATPDCDVVNCGSPSTPSNGDVDTSSGTDYNDVAIFSCDTGYTMLGSSTTTCQADGSWSNATPICYIVDCGVPTAPSSGSVDVSFGTNFTDSATYSCNVGYTMSGTALTTCQAGGAWSNGTPTCNIVNCGSLTAPGNGVVDISSGTDYSDVASYSCNTGYSMSGPSATTCQADGSWNNGAPTCSVTGNSWHVETHLYIFEFPHHQTDC